MLLFVRGNSHTRGNIWKFIVEGLQSCGPAGAAGHPWPEPCGWWRLPAEDVKRKAFGYFLVHAEKVLGFMAVLLTTHGNATDHIMHVSLQSEHAKEMYRAAAPHFN